ncbi:VOC family protein [Virgibacillus sp. 6R]|uniref:VOC family protein n=1 Tax=Metabacillus sp. 22489 TaxID=3453928 RepID=UPI00119E2A99
MSININLIVIRTLNFEQTVSFYQDLGLIFNKERHGNGPEHYACEFGSFVFEIYPSQSRQIDATTRIGFDVDNIERIIEKLRLRKAQVVTEPNVSIWGKRDVLEDPDGRKVELVEALKK